MFGVGGKEEEEEFLWVIELDVIENGVTGREEDDDIFIDSAFNSTIGAYANASM